MKVLHDGQSVYGYGQSRDAAIAHACDGCINPETGKHFTRPEIDQWLAVEKLWFDDWTEDELRASGWAA